MSFKGTVTSTPNSFQVGEDLALNRRPFGQSHPGEVLLEAAAHPRVLKGLVALERRESWPQAAPISRLLRDRLV